MKFIRILTPMLMCMVLLAGCETMPAQQMSDARQALKSAKDAGAALYAPTLYSEAQQLLDDADRFAGNGRYDLAAKVAERARIIAIKARRTAMSRGSRLPADQ